MIENYQGITQLGNITKFIVVSYKKGVYTITRDSKRILHSKGNANESLAEYCKLNNINFLRKI